MSPAERTLPAVRPGERRGRYGRRPAGGGRPRRPAVLAVVPAGGPATGGLPALRIPTGTFWVRTVSY